MIGYECGREDSDPRFINNSADVKLRSFTTKVCSTFQLVSLCSWNQPSQADVQTMGMPGRALYRWMSMGMPGSNLGGIIDAKWSD